MAEVKSEFRLSLKEFSDAVGIERNYLRRQMEGKARPQIEKVYSVERFQHHLSLAMLKNAAGVRVSAVIQVEERIA